MGDWPFTTRSAAVATVGLLTLVLVGAACGSGMAGGAGVAAPPADLPVETSGAGTGPSGTDMQVCGGGNGSCGAHASRTVLGPDAAPHTIVTSDPAEADCFIVHPTGAHDQAFGEVVRVLPTARALASTCRVFVSSLTETSARASTDDTVNAFVRYVDTESDGRPFVVVSDSFEASLMSLAVLDAISARPELRRRYIASVLPGMAPGSTTNALPLCTVLEHLGCVIGAPVVRDLTAQGDTAPGITSGWAGACVDDDLVDCDVLALVHSKIEAFGLTTKTDGR